MMGFEHIYCINLDHRTDRWRESLIEFSKVGANVTRFVAIQPKKGIEGLNAGQYGCLLSHMYLLIMARVNNWPYVVILEDDVEFADNFNEALQHIPADFDMLYFGGSDKYEVAEPVNERISRLKGGTMCTHAYIVNATIYDLMIAELSKMNNPIDVLYSNVHAQINCYGFRPKIAFQRESYSDILGKRVRYKSATNDPNPKNEW